MYNAIIVNGSQPFKELAELLPVIEAKVKERTIYRDDYFIIKDIYCMLTINDNDARVTQKMLNCRIDALKGIIRSDGMYRESPESTEILTKAVSILEGILSENFSR